MNKVKVFIAMIAVALGGLIIWSCTQDEMENGQVTYRYSAEEIATLRAMAEKYGMPEVAFPTKSNQKLPSVEKMQNIFKMLALLKANVSTSIVMTDSTANEVIYKNSIVYYNSDTYRAELITGSAHFYCNFQHSREGGGFRPDIAG